MATFFIPGEVITSVGIFGGGAPDSGYYAATITSIEQHPTKVTSRKMSLEFAGFSTFDWLNSPFDADGNQLPGLSENQVRGMVAAIKTVLVSAGFSNEQMGEGVTDDWLIGKTVYLEWNAAQDIGAQYGRIKGYINEDKFKAFKAEGTKPAVAMNNNGGNVAGSSATVAPNPTANSVKLPPPPSAQSVVQ